MIDFEEFLGRGILAARNGQPAKALENLSVAAQIKPDHPRVWLWLAAVAERRDLKQRFLREALQRDPKLVIAQALLVRLEGGESRVNLQADDFAIFHCPACGGQQQFDPDAGGLVCSHCMLVEPLGAAAARPAAALDPELRDSSANWAVFATQATCRACGARTGLAPEKTTFTCPFCGSALVSLQPGTPDLVMPADIIPFQIQPADFLPGLAERWQTAPARLNHLLDRGTITLNALYLPFWRFGGKVQIRCALSYPVRPQVYSPTERVVDKGLWQAESWFECDVQDVLIYAGRSIPAKTLAWVEPFKLQALVEYRPEFLAGWQAELYQVALADAGVAAYKRMRDLGFQRATRRLLFMDPGRMLADDVALLNQTYDLLLLPLWIVRHPATGGPGLTLINGQTGETAGDKPDHNLRK